jgi:hypothetical protein
MERFLDRFLKCKIIVNCEQQMYLTRWFIWRGKNLGIYIHKFHRSDEDRALHDHPWSFLSIILWRGYYEVTQNKKGARLLYANAPLIQIKKRKWPGMILYRPATWRHRVELLRTADFENQSRSGDFLNSVRIIESKELPAWSLIIRFRRLREWGFWTNMGFVHNQDWWNQHCED